MRNTAQGARDHRYFHVADGVPLNREHWKLVIVLVVALAVDVLKPATLGFVMPGMSAEYEITKPTAGLLALVGADRHHRGLGAVGPAWATCSDAARRSCCRR